jgi:hypothetical protein
MLVHFSGEIELVFGWLVTSSSLSLSLRTFFLLITIEIVVLVKNPPTTFLIRSSNITIIYFYFSPIKDKSKDGFPKYTQDIEKLLKSEKILIVFS